MLVQFLLFSWYVWCSGKVDWIWNQWSGFESRQSQAFKLHQRSCAWESCAEKLHSYSLQQLLPADTRWRTSESVTSFCPLGALSDANPAGWYILLDCSLRCWSRDFFDNHRSNTWKNKPLSKTCYYILEIKLTKKYAFFNSYSFVDAHFTQPQNVIEISNG